MRIYLRWVAAWVLYWLGHTVSRLDCFDNDKLDRCWLPVCSRLMVWSNDIQGPSDFGPWRNL